jgi:hypothetical protein
MGPDPFGDYNVKLDSEALVRMDEMSSIRQTQIGERPLDVVDQNDPGIVRWAATPRGFVRNAAKCRVGGGVEDLLLKSADELRCQF